MIDRKTTPASPRSTHAARRRWSFSDAPRRALLLTAALSMIGCAAHPRIGAPGSPMLEPRSLVVLPPSAAIPEHDASQRPLYIFPEYSRRDRELGLRR
jgi:hypothetical protein